VKKLRIHILERRERCQVIISGKVEEAIKQKSKKRRISQTRTPEAREEARN